LAFTVAVLLILLTGYRAPPLVVFVDVLKEHLSA
jgi:hypothetical protein